jgi:hypothetical protein
MHQDVLHLKERICVGNVDDWRRKLLKELHDSLARGHSGSMVTYYRMK